MQGSTVEYGVINLVSKLLADGHMWHIAGLDLWMVFQVDELNCSKKTGTQPCNSDALTDMPRFRNYRPAYS